MNPSARQPGSKKRVLFLCTGNSARSQMAEAFLRQMAGDRFEAHSAGLSPRPIHPMTRRVMQEVGIDISGQRSKGLNELKLTGSILFLVILCAGAEEGCPDSFAPAATRLAWPFEDPSKATGSESARLKKFREARDAIRARLEAWLDQEVPREWLEGEDR